MGIALGTSACKRAPVLVPLGLHAPALWSWFDLPKSDPRTSELSGIAWDAVKKSFFAVQDNDKRIVELIPDASFRSWTIGSTIDVRCDFDLDLEGIVVLPDGSGFLLSSEEGPKLLDVDRRGDLRRELHAEERFRGARHNKSLESLTLSPSARFVFTTTEVALRADGPPATAHAGTRVRLVALTTEAGANYDRVASEHCYATDPKPWDDGDWGIADLAAVSDDELLVLERGWRRGFGNVIRVYRTKLEPRSSSRGKEQLADVPPVPKTLLVDLQRLSSDGIPPARQPQPHPILDNFEGLCLGPRLPNGRPSLVLISDDNGHEQQAARVLVLSL